MALARKLQVMVWNWLEYRMNLQHIGQAWTILDHLDLSGPIWTIVNVSWTHCLRGLLWNTFVHVVMYAYYGLKVRLKKNCGVFCSTNP